MTAHNTYRFSIIQGELEIRSCDSGLVTWRGKPNGIDVIDIFPILGAQSCIVLLDWRVSEQLQEKNLLRLDPFGKIVWVIGNPGPRPIEPIGSKVEIYTGVTSFSNQNIHVYTGSGYSDSVDILTGEIIDSVFVK
ncbi:MAG TPA: hypothetical protein PKM01_08645 [Anaerolineaceae bacterium]|nr:hypothetical protein [Anaerolineaceae bacterium]